MKQLFFFLLTSCFCFCTKEPKMLKTSVDFFAFDEITKEPLDSIRVEITNRIGGGGCGMGGLFCNISTNSSANNFYFQKYTDKTGRFQTSFYGEEDSKDYNLIANSQKFFNYYQIDGKGQKLVIGTSNKVELSFKTPATYRLEINRNNMVSKIDSFKFYLSNQDKPLVWSWHTKGKDTIAFGTDNSGNLILSSNNIVFYTTLTVFHSERIQGNTYVKRTFGFKRNGSWSVKSDSVFCKMFTTQLDTIFY